MNSTLEMTNPELAEYRRNNRYDPYSYSANPADEETDYEYDQENRLTKAILPSGVEVGKYHYIGGQITTIEVDAVEVDDSDPPVETAVRDETLHIHLGPNSQPLSWQWERYDYTEEETLSDTYYYHYDLHGNVIKVTDSSATTKISYGYDVLGEISSVTNPDGITNPFTFRGGTQTLYDEELELYFGGGYYRADLGTTLSSSGIASNPTSGVTTSGQAQASKPSSQSAGEKRMAAGSSNTLLSVEEMAGMMGDSRGNNIIGGGDGPIILDNNETREPRYSGTVENHFLPPRNGAEATAPPDEKDEDDDGDEKEVRMVDPGYQAPILDWEDIPEDVREQILDKEGIPSDGNGNVDPNASDEAKKAFEALKESLMWVVWGVGTNDNKEYEGQNRLLGYQKDGHMPRFFFPNGEEFTITSETHFGDFCWQWRDKMFVKKSVNFTGFNIVVVACGTRKGSAEKGTLHTMKLYIPAIEGTSIYGSVNLEHCDLKNGDTRGGPHSKAGDIMSPGNIIVVKGAPNDSSSGQYEVWDSNGNLILRGNMGWPGIGRDAWHEFFFDDWDGYTKNTPGHWEDTDGDGIPEWHPH